MRLGFVTVLTNDFDARELMQKLAQTEAGIDLEFEQAPTVLNAPAAVKKVFSNGLDACIVFVQSSGEEKLSLALAQEKIVDVEVAAGKYCIVCTVLDEEGAVDALAEERLLEALNLLLGVRPEKSSETPSLDFFSTPSGSPEILSSPSESQSEQHSGEGGSSGGRPLF